MPIAKQEIGKLDENCDGLIDGADPSGLSVPEPRASVAKGGCNATHARNDSGLTLMVSLMLTVFALRHRREC